MNIRHTFFKLKGYLGSYVDFIITSESARAVTLLGILEGQLTHFVSRTPSDTLLKLLRLKIRVEQYLLEFAHGFKDYVSYELACKSHPLWSVHKNVKIAFDIRAIVDTVGDEQVNPSLYPVALQAIECKMELTLQPSLRGQSKLYTLLKEIIPDPVSNGYLSHP